MYSLRKSLILVLLMTPPWISLASTAQFNASDTDSEPVEANNYSIYLHPGGELQHLEPPPQDRLYRWLMDSYDRSTRPVLKANTQLRVTFSVQVNRLMDLDEKNQILHLNAIVVESWLDQRLAWEPTEFDGLTATVLPANELWLPDIYVYNNAADGNDGFINDNYSRVTVDHHGQVLWNIPTGVQSSCSVDVLYFPFDHQFCEILFASWTYDSSQLMLTLPDGESGVDSSQMHEHQELKVSDIRMSLRHRSMLNNLTYPMLSLKMHIERKALYYSYTVIAPSIMLCVLTMFSFWLPCHIAEKIEIGLNVFLFLYFLELLIAENTPESNSTPLIGIFLSMVMTLNSLSLIMATVVMHVHSQGGQDPCPRVPGWLWILGSRLLGPMTFSCTQLQRTLADEAAMSGRDQELQEIEKNEDDEDDDDGPEGEASGNVSKRNRLEQLKWTYLAEVIDKFLFEFYLISTVLSVLIVLHWMPEANSRRLKFENF